MAAVFVSEHCPLCGATRPALHRMRAVWYRAAWDIDPHDRAHQTREEHWIPVCGQCASQAALFRIDYPRQLARQQRDTLRLIVAGTLTLLILLLVLWAGRPLVGSDPDIWKNLYGAGWFLFGIGLLFTLRLAWRVLRFELTAHASWSAPWLEGRLAQFLALPQGDDKPYWWEIALTEGLDTLPIDPPAEEPRLPPPVTSITRNYLFTPLLALLLLLPRAALADPIVIGIEYATQGLAGAYAPTGIAAAKPAAEGYMWGQMQTKSGGKFDFTHLDRLVTEYQAAGFTRLMIPLRSNCGWGSKALPKNPSPRPAHEGEYAAWVGAIVERYDFDGQADMPGLSAPVSAYEIGSEFSSYEPEPVADYLAMLRLAHGAAKRADPDVWVLHAAFLTTNAFDSDPTAAQYEAAFAALPKRYMDHDLDDMRAVLDDPELFDAVNVHSLGHPSEIPPLVAWLNWEMAQRQYSKPIVISDTFPTSFAGWGIADTCTGLRGMLAILVEPATEADRCRLAAYFQDLIAQEPPTAAWTEAHIARDTVQRVVIAAASGVAWINTAFQMDLPLLTAKAFHAGAGVSAWGGMVDAEFRLLPPRWEATAKRPAWYALRQVQSWLADVQAVVRVPQGDERIHLYLLGGGTGARFIAWYDPGTLLLPGDPDPVVPLRIGVEGDSVIVEQVWESRAQGKPNRSTPSAINGEVEVLLTPTPLLIARP